MGELIESNRVIDKEQLRLAFQQGAISVINKKKSLNDMNVFPVADGDTGSNLASLMQGIIEETGQQFQSIKEVFDAVAEAALVSARGNSGIIFAQYLNGFAKQIEKEALFSSLNFVESAKAAVKDAYAAIENPMEGTMITVIRAWAESLDAKEADLKITLSRGLDNARYALKETPKQLKILQKNNVVDAGAKGFVLFLEGFTEMICRQGETESIIDSALIQEQLSVDVSQSHHQFDSVPLNRYCTEVLIEGEDLVQEEIKALLQDLGDSMVVATGSKKARIHIHSNQPAEVMRRLRKMGRILQQKADDMLLQFEVNTNQKYPIALVTDSIADLPAEFVLKEQIHVLPMNLIINDVNYLDKLTIQPTEFYEMNRVENGTASSSQPSLKAIENLFSYLETRYQEIIVVTVASALSGTYSSIKEGAKKFQQKGTKIAIIDSKQNSAAEGLLVMEAAEWIAKGESFDTIVARVVDARATTKILVSVNQLDAMIQSGRLPGIVGKIAQKVHLKPIVSLNEEGGGSVEGVTFSTKSNEKRLLKEVKKMQRHHSIKRYAIIDANDEKRAKRFANQVKAELGFEPHYLMEISTVVAMSAGEECIAIALSMEDREMEEI
ncbi:fatty acid-binding protein DegV [Carnobacterium divergens]|uniref:DegV family protein n=1 Tax=Carnobacterium divergens TaxID=2748 RepID=UPI0010725CB5|nr:DegV family protein [Carnobacterium divergens]TFJ41776.1 fatty acid-binding protein DegV [Carnobacterium divergens]TFJ50674.1 fatty acid-binding protein DegV [Carnobacterium divergens]TFJ55250.1 fatty acid-binding protein DegV [Carnobacterium divergens]TFJ62389.1 fatty acid-binding protein DegV [Carnobacterium divergens]TFJ72445.1 fatty acid-binding protein DegV [Carnobacterium divergens]